MKLLIGDYDRDGGSVPAESVTVRWSLVGDKGKFVVERSATLGEVIDLVRKEKAKVDEHPEGFHDGV